jgi:acyl-CoA reductase-like NAD-dependent aldehyde dehydrogenase
MTVDIHNPASPSEIVASYPLMQIADLDPVFDAARAAQKLWAKMPQPERVKLVTAFLDGLAGRSEDIGRSITLEMGKIIGESRGEVGKALGEGRACVSRAGNPVGEVFPSQKPDVTAYTIRRPRGVILGINPWDFPFSSPIRKTIPALVYGNAMVLKPSINTPGAAYIMQEVADATLPKGVFQVVLGSGAFNSALTDCYGVDGISFTGSVAVGKIVAQAAARNLTEISLELGGKNPVILNDTSNLDDALDQIFAATFAVCGQRCTGISRVIVHADLHDVVVKGLAKRADAAVVGNGMEASTTMGPVSSDAQMRDVSGFVDRAVTEGAVLEAGGSKVETPSGGLFYRPTILSAVTPDMEIATREVFGPVLAIFKYQTPDEAIEIANDVEYGLSACLYSEQFPLVQQFIGSMESGMIHVNVGSFPEDHLPFVGAKNSSLGVGGSDGPSTIQFYTSEHSVYVKAQA